MNSCADAVVYVVDDDSSLRKSLSRLLRSAGYQAHAFESADEFLSFPLVESPSCLILDVKMPGMTGPGLQEKLYQQGALIPVVFLSGNATVPTSVKAMKLGAIDFLTKPVDDAVLLDAISRSLEQSRQVLADKAAMDDIRQRLAMLTPRELDVMKQVVTGALNKQIADALGIAEKTVKVHRAQVMRKLGVDSVAELVRLNERAKSLV